MIGTPVPLDGGAGAVLAPDDLGGCLGEQHALARSTAGYDHEHDGDDGENLTLTRTWMVSDACGNTASQMQTVFVEDMTPPMATAGLTLLSSGDNEGGGSDHDDDEGIFAVVASCSDNCAGVGGCAVPTLSAVLSCSNGQTVTVSPGAVVEIEVEDEGGCEIEVENGRLEIEGMVTLIVTCTDASGNTSTATAIPEGLAPDNDTEDEDDD